MKKSNWLGVALSVVVLVVFLVWSPADAQKEINLPVTVPVNVVNTAASPVKVVATAPIPVTGSLAISNGAVPVTGTVYVGGSASVNVVNDLSNPVFVRDIGSHEKVPFAFSVTNESSISYQVPPNKILVIEHVYGNCTDPDLTPSQPFFIVIWAFTNSIETDYTIPNKTQDRCFDSGGGEYISYKLSEEVKIYCDPGTRVRLCPIHPGMTLDGLTSGRITGYLVDAL